MITNSKVTLYQRLFFLLCLVGCAVQLAHIIHKFVQYNVVSKVFLSYPASITVPELTICSEYIDVINYTAYLLNYPDQIPSGCQSLDVSTEDGLRTCFSSVIGSNQMRAFIKSTFTVAQFYNITYSPETIFPQINVTAEVNKGTECYASSLIISRRVCYQIKCSRGKPLTVSRFSLRDGDLKGAMTVITINQSIVRNWGFTIVYIHEASTFPYGYESSWVGLAFNRISSIYLVKYKLIQVDLLPKPYATACRDYEAMGFDNRLGYFDDCINQRSLKELGSPSHRTFVDPTLNIPFPSYELKHHSRVYRDIESGCQSEISQPQCHYKFYISSNEGWYPTEDNNSQIMLLAPNEPDLHAVTLPTYDFYQFLLFAESILGIWFGFNYYGHGKIFFQTLNEYAKKDPKVRWKEIKRRLVVSRLASKPNLNKRISRVSAQNIKAISAPKHLELS